MITEYEVYSDEREVSASGRRWFFLGGVACTQAARQRLLASLSQVRVRHSLSSEMKWGKVSARYLDAYRDWADAFFDDSSSRFSILCADRSSNDWRSLRLRNHRRTSSDDRLASAFYQFLLVTFGRVSDTKRWWVYPDFGLFSRDAVLNRVEFLFNRTYKRAFGPKSSRIIRLARPQDSARTDLVQLADVLLGALSFRVVGGVPDSRPKAELVAHCEARLASDRVTRRGLQKLALREWQLPDSFQYPSRRTPSNNSMQLTEYLPQ